MALQIGNVKVGFDQLTQTAPIYYKRFINMLIMFVVPATVSFMEVFVNPTNTDLKLRVAQSGVFIIGILKGLEYFLGDDTNPINSNNIQQPSNPPTK